MICHSTGMRFAAVARVTQDRWITCAAHDELNFGLKPGDELMLETTICHEIRDHGVPVVIDEVACDPIFAEHHTPAMYGFQSYISVPIRLKDGTFFGTLCAIEPLPLPLKSSRILENMTIYADLIAFHLESIREHRQTELRLKIEKENADLRDQFIAILGHDLRNPLSASNTAAQLLLSMDLGETANKLAALIKNSTFRMSSLVANVLDFARGKMIGDLKLEITNDTPLNESVEGILAEMELVWPGRTIQRRLHPKAHILHDPRRLAQLVSNLLGNALNYGDPAHPILVETGFDNGDFLLSVTNQGEPIPDHVREHLFQPFIRGKNTANRQGLGLGLFISALIARAHRGELHCVSTPEGTTFSLRIPVNPNSGQELMPEGKELAEQA